MLKLSLRSPVFTPGLSRGGSSPSSPRTSVLFRPDSGISADILQEEEELPSPEHQGSFVPIESLVLQPQRTARPIPIPEPSPLDSLSQTISTVDGHAEPLLFEKEDFPKFVRFFRQASSYIEGHSGKTFVVVIPGNVSDQGRCRWVPASLMDSFACETMHNQVTIEGQLLKTTLSDLAVLHGELPLATRCPCASAPITPSLRRPRSQACRRCRRAGLGRGAPQGKGTADPCSVLPPTPTCN